MKIEQIYTDCLAEAAYYIESEGEAAIIDPLREVAPYIEMAKERGTQIKYIFESHFHADFVSGHLDLAKETGASIIFGPTAQPAYDAHIAEDGEEFKLGKVTIKLLHTPGHTMESSCFLLLDENQKPHGIFTGDTLFIGDVGRPDLAVSSDTSKEDLAGYLYESLRRKILPLPDETIVYPGHGQGSACGKNMSAEKTDTLGHQKAVNYALRTDMSKEEFVKEVIDGILPPPQYFPKNAQLNKGGYTSFEEVLAQGLTALDVEAFTQSQSNGVLVIDTRSKEEFAQAHIPGSYFIGLDGSFASWVGTLIPNLKQPLAIVANEGKEEEVVTRLARVGYDNCTGYLKGGMNMWTTAGKPTHQQKTISAIEFANLASDMQLKVIDVRRPSEFLSEHLIGAESFPLDYIFDHLEELDKDENYFLHCKSGYRSMIANSILQAQGFENITDVAGGFQAIKETKAPVSQYVCPTTV